MSGHRWLVPWAVGYAAVGAASLAVPLYAILLGGGPVLVGVLASSAAFAGVPGAVVWGRRAASTRRPRFLALVLGTVGVALLATGLLTSPWLLVVPNALVWFVTAAATPVLTLAGVEGRPTAEWDREIGRLNAAQGYGWLAGLLVGGLWTAGLADVLTPGATYRLLFATCAVASLVASVLGYRWMPAGAPPTASAAGDESPLSADGPRRYPSARLRRLVEEFGTDGRATWYVGRRGGGWRFGAGTRGLDRAAVGRATGALRDRFEGVRRRTESSLGGYLAGLTLCFLGFATVFGPLPAFLAARNYAPDQIFALFVVSSACSAVCYGPAARLAGRVGGRRLHVAGLAVRGLALPVVTLVGAPGTGATGFVVLAVLFGVVGATWAVVAVTAGGLVTRLASESGRGQALGAYTALSNVGTGVGSALGGVAAASLGYVTTFVGGSLFVLLGAATMLGVADTSGDDG